YAYPSTALIAVRSADRSDGCRMPRRLTIGAELAGDRHYDNVRPGRVIRSVAYHNCRSLLQSHLVREGKWNQHHIPKLIGHRIRRLPDWSRLPRMRVRSLRH